MITVSASDQDSGKDGLFDFRIVSVTPKPQDLDFYLTHIAGTQSGTISFKGCLDHDVSGLFALWHLLMLELPSP